MRSYIAWPLILALGAAACGWWKAEAPRAPRPEDYKIIQYYISSKNVTVLDTDNNGKADLVLGRENASCFYAPGFEGKCPPQVAPVDRYPLSDAALAAAVNVLNGVQVLPFEMDTAVFEREQKSRATSR